MNNQTQDNWISCETDLPHCFEQGEWDGLRSEKVFILHGKEEPAVAVLYSGILDGNKFNDFFSIDDYEIANVTHWMPIKSLYNPPTKIESKEPTVLGEETPSPKVEQEGVKEKAKELIKKFSPKCAGNSQSEMNWQLAKQCAIICVDEIRNIPYHKWMSEKQANEFCYYWQSVKHEISKL